MNDPIGQDEHLLDPINEYDPSGHTKQTLAVVLVENVPPWHSVHSFGLLTANVPAVQASQVKESIFFL